MLRLMGRLRRKVWVLVGCGIAALLILTLWREREPQYKGRSLSQWLAILDRGDPLISTQEAETAVRQIGTNGIPVLLKWLEYQQPPWRARLGMLCYKLPEKLAEPFERLVVGPGPLRQRYAYSALYLLAQDASPAIPVLARHIAGPASEGVVVLIAHMGDAGLPTVLPIATNAAERTILRTIVIQEVGNGWAQFASTNALVSALICCLQDTNEDVTIATAKVLCLHKIQRDVALQKLVQVSEGPDKRVRQRAATYLRECLSASFPPERLVQFLQDTNSPFTRFAAAGLGDLAENRARLPETVVPALANCLRDPRPAVRMYTACALGFFGEQAEPAVPALLDAWNDPDKSVRQFATNAFFQLPAYNVLKTEPQSQILERRYGLTEEQVVMLENRYRTRPPVVLPHDVALSNLLSHPDIRVREMATNAFRKFNE